MAGNGGRLGRADVAALGLIGLLPIGFLYRLCLAGQILYGPDALAYFYPMYEYATGRLLSGELPLWNPHLFLGAPFLANPQAGVLYPVHLALAWLSAPSLATASLAIHYGLAGASTYLLARAGLGYGRWPALGAAATFALSGLLGAQAEHFNQVEALAWLPLQVLAVELGAIRRLTSAAGRRLWLLVAMTLSAVQLLTGHSQAGYIAHITLVAYAAVRLMAETTGWPKIAGRWGRALLFIGAGAAGGMALSAVQVLPTLELAELSVRAGGLSYRQAVSFSFGPRSWLLGLLPHYGAEAPYSEYVAYAGVVGTGLAVLGVCRGTSSRPRWAVALVALGAFLALGGYNPFYYLLYRLVPGIGLFRAPARWLVMSLLGASVLVAEGIAAAESGRQWALPRRWWGLGFALTAAVTALLWLLADPRPQPVTVAGWLAAGVALLLTVRLAPRRRMGTALMVLVLVELFAASQRLPYNQTTASYVYEAQRRSVQVLLQEAGLSRFLSLSDPQFDSGDMGDLLASLGEGLNAEGRYGLLVGAKSQEVLSRNLALKWGLYAVDGYDGGVLPTADHLAFQSLYLPAEEVAADGRMSEALRSVPPERLLALASVGYLLRDRLDDLWLEGVYYDLGFSLPGGLDAPEATLSLPRFPATDLGLVLGRPTNADAAEGLAARISLDGMVVGEIRWDGDAFIAWGSDGASVEVAPVPGRPDLRHVSLRLLSAPTYGDRLEVQWVSDALSGASWAEGEPVRNGGAFTVAAASLINRAAGVGVPVALSQIDGIVPIHLGDVKVSSVERSLPRAYFSSCVVRVPGEAEAMEILRDSGFDPRRRTVLVGGEGMACDAEGWLAAEVVSYAPERVVVEVLASRPGHLVLTDSFYPGWRAEVDGVEVEVERANWFFRSVAVEGGHHRVEFVYRPDSVRWGAVASCLAVVLLLITGALWARLGAS
ncbi:MAG: YfhO family protein [Anaerolineae bacterium]|nr:YfhO family protein [Anaerolineae bacterium]